jgi:hypothetical protein
MKLLVLLLGAEAAVLSLQVVAHRGVRTVSVVEAFHHLTS